jgi:hypothetical protein
MNEAQSRLLAEVEAFMRQHRLSDSTFGRRAVGDWKFVRRLRDGANMTLTTMDRAAAFMRRSPMPASGGAAAPLGPAPEG